MQSIAVDDQTRHLFSAIREYVEIRDSEGVVLGYFSPLALVDVEAVEFVQSRADLAALERRKREQHGKGVTTQELLDRLKALEQPT